MPPRKSSSRASSRGPAPVTQYGAAVRDELPPLPSRIQTSYGSEYSQRLINPRRGQRRVLNSAIDDALQEAVDDTSEPVIPEEEEEDEDEEEEEEEHDQGDECQHDEAEPEGQEETASPRSEEDRTRKARQLRDSESALSPEQETVAPLPSRSLFQPRRPGRQDLGESSQRLAPRPVFGSRTAVDRSRRTTVSPAPTPRPASRRRPASQEPSPANMQRPSLPNGQAVGDLDSSRSYTNESGIFRITSINTPQPDNQPPRPGDGQGHNLFEETDRMHSTPPQYKLKLMESNPGDKAAENPQLTTALQKAPPRRSGRTQVPEDENTETTNSTKPAAPTVSRQNTRTADGAEANGANAEAAARQNVESSRASRDATTGSSPPNEESPARTTGRRAASSSTGTRRRTTRAPVQASSQSRRSATAVPYFAAPQSTGDVHVGNENGLVQSLVDAIRAMAYQLGRFVRDLSQQKTMGYVRAMVTVAGLVFFAMVMTSMFTTRPEFGNFHWYGWDDVSHNVGQFIPFSLRYGFQGLDPEDRVYHEILDKADYEITHLTQTTRLHDDSIRKLEQLMPKIVYVPVGKDKKLVVGDDFWHALRDLIKADEHVLTFDETRSDLEVGSDKHWAALKKRFEEELRPGHMPRVWERWIESNREKVTKILSINQTSPLQPDKDMAEAITRLMKEKLKSGDLDATLVTREEFMRHVDTEFKSHRQEIRQEFIDMEPKLKDYVQGVIQGALKNQPSGPSGVTRAEVLEMVNTAVRKAISDAHLAAMAKGKVMAAWDDELRHHVNFLTHNTGAVINVPKSSPIYVQEKPWVGTKEWLKWGRTPQPRSKAHDAVLTRWDDAGDCWCGAISNPVPGSHFRGVWTSINLGYSVIPQHVVIEHILPGATLLPDARPKHMEIWAAIEGVAQQELVSDFAATHFPDDDVRQYCPPDEPSRCYFKIAAFTYEPSTVDNGVYVHRLRDQLVAMAAATDHVRVVATSNYGNKDQTCFYRIRMYGELVPDEDALDDEA